MHFGSATTEVTVSVFATFCLNFASIQRLTCPSLLQFVSLATSLCLCFMDEQQAMNLTEINDECSTFKVNIFTWQYVIST